MSTLCPICSGLMVEPVGDRDGYPMGRCGGCGHLYCLRMPDEATLTELYRAYSYETNHLASIPAFVKQSLARLMATFEPYRRSGRLLDVGFGAGTVLLAAQTAGWEAHGLEKSSLAVAQAQRAGFGHAREGDFLSPPYDPGSFDVITLADVVEHLVDPLPFFEQARTLLRPGGLLYVSTPNSRSLSAFALGLSWSVVSPPEHVNLFSRSSMEQTLLRTGFAGSVVRTEGLNPYEIVNRLRQRLRPPRAASLATTGPGASAAISPDDPPALSRVQSAYALNAILMGSGLGRGLKQLANQTLTWVRLGDELKVWATAPAP